MKISDWWFYFKTKFKHVSLHDPIHPIEKTTQENPRDVQAVKRVNKLFDAQAQQLQDRALKPHSAKCLDPLTCTKVKCFKVKPDKIVSKKVVSVESVREDMKKRAKKKVMKLA